MLHKLCKVFLTFFKKEGDDTDELAVCDGRSVKMFADMIMKFLRNEDFVSDMILKTILRVIFMGLFTFFNFLFGYELRAIYCFLLCL